MNSKDQATMKIPDLITVEHKATYAHGSLTGYVPHDDTVQSVRATSQKHGPLWPAK